MGRVRTLILLLAGIALPVALGLAVYATAGATSPGSSTALPPVITVPDQIARTPAATTTTATTTTAPATTTSRECEDALDPDCDPREDNSGKGSSGSGSGSSGSGSGSGSSGSGSGSGSDDSSGHGSGDDD